ncbi:MAG: pyruvate kinase [Ferrimicrobium sp.]
MGVRRTKIVCSIGPASARFEVLQQLIATGMDVARINFSHGSYEDHHQAIASVRLAATAASKTVGILADLCGPKVRITGMPVGEPLELGDEIGLIEGTGDDPGSYSITPLGVLTGVRVGESIAFADGTVRAEVVKIDGDQVRLRITQPGALSIGKGVNFPDSVVALPSMTDKDRDDLAFALVEGVDFVALSFVSRGSDIDGLRALIASQQPRLLPRIIAKIERKAALRHIDEIVSAADGVMVARGDLGVETPVERVPIEQKRIIHLANALGKPVITATQMLESMITSAEPTRAEASDVANAIVDGTDAVMLSAETAVGRYPVEAVGYMDRIARATEDETGDSEVTLIERPPMAVSSVADAIGYSAQSIARQLAVRLVVAVTESGHSGRVISRFRPTVPILGATPDPDAARSLTLNAGVIPVVVKRSPSTEVMMQLALNAALDAGLVELGDLVVIVGGIPFGVRGTTNLIKIQAVGDGFLSSGEPVS